MSGTGTAHLEQSHAAPHDFSKLDSEIARIAPKEHLCLVYKTRDEQLGAAVRYMKTGLERGERCLYISDENTSSTVAEALRKVDVDVDSAVRSGALILANSRETYVKDGAFDPDAMIELLAEMTRGAEEAGFTALRVTGEMTWALGHDVPMERVIEYEAKLNRFFGNAPASAICQYSLERFKPELIEDILHTHPKVVYGGLVCDNPYYVPPEEFLRTGSSQQRVERLLNNIVTRAKMEQDYLDLTRDLEQRVTDRTRELARANADLESFGYTVSHDLRAPLRAVEAVSRALEEDYADKLDGEGRRQLAWLRTESERISRLVKDLLNLSQVARGELRLDTVDLSALARLVVQDLRRADPEREVDVRVEDGLSAEADVRLMRVVLENLIGNAWKYTSRTPDAQIDVRAETRSGVDGVLVRDNGAGFDMSKADRLFVPFQRLHGAAEFDGTGVGLATVARIVRRHGGRVLAEGAPGRGASFWFSV